jgi:putative Holliday junction resolvase
MTTNGRILAIDYGTRRVGLAISDPTNTIACPLPTLDRRKNNTPLEERVADTARELNVSLVIVGLPITTSGEKGDRAREVEAFVSRLRPLINSPVDTLDERFSSVRATRIIHELGGKAGKDKGRVDRISALIILQNYLDAGHNSKGTPPPPGS